MNDDMFNPYAFLNTYFRLPEAMLQASKIADMKSFYDMGAGMLDFWKQFNSDTSESEQPLFSKTVEQVRLFNLFGEKLLNLLKGADNADVSTDENKQYRQLEGFFDQLKAVFSEQKTGIDNTFWQSFFSKESAQAAMGAFFMPNKQAQPLFNQSFFTPAIGCTRELQEQAQTGMRLLETYFNRLNEFTRAHSAVELKALDCLKDKLIARAAHGEAVSSLKQLYMVWVDAHQAIYATFISSKEYSLLYGGLVNSLMQYKKHCQQSIEPLLTQMNIPTRDSVNTVAQRQQQARRSLHNIKQQLEEDQTRIKTLEQQVSALIKKLKQLDAGKKSTASRVRKTATKEKKR